MKNFIGWTELRGDDKLLICEGQWYKYNYLLSLRQVSFTILYGNINNVNVVILSRSGVPLYIVLRFHLMPLSVFGS